MKLMNDGVFLSKSVSFRNFASAIDVCKIEIAFVVWSSEPTLSINPINATNCSFRTKGQSLIIGYIARHLAAPRIGLANGISESMSEKSPEALGLGA